MVNNFWENKKVLITGGHGFVGRYVVQKLYERHLIKDQMVLFHKSEFDLRREEDVKRLFKINKDINIVMHLAGDVGGIGYNREFPGSVFYNNIMMNTLAMEYSRLNGVKRFVDIGSVCSYPEFAYVPFKEEELWDGYPEETNASYGLAKKMMLVQGQAYRQQFRFNAVHLLMVNLYGPGDNFDLENSHVIAGLIRKFVDAKRENREKVVVWGTGKASREFLYVDDAVEAIVLATEKYNKPYPVNIGMGSEITIKDLVKRIVELTEFDGRVVWDSSKPDGQLRRMLDVSRAEKEFGFKAKTPLEEGLKKTIEWYTTNSKPRKRKTL